MGRHTRVHYMDNLRAFAIILGVLFHAALAYSPSLNQLWMTADPNNSVVVDFLAFFSHSFRMPLFFVIAGFFAAMLVDKRGVGKMLKNRAMRIALPFVIFLPLIIASFAVLIGWSIEGVEQKSPMLGFIAMMSQVPDAPPPPLTTTHLWFLYNLIFFCGLAAIFAKFVKFDWMAKLTGSPLAFLLLAPLALVPALMTQHAPLPAPEQFLPQLWSFGYFGLFFMLGWGFFKHQDFLDKLQPYSWALLIVSIVAYVAYFQTFPGPVSMQEAMVAMGTAPELGLKQAGVALLGAVISLYMSLALLLLGKRFFNKQNSVARYVSQSSYWIYIIHLPVLWFIQFLLLDTNWSLTVEFLISSLGNLAIGFVTHILLVKWSPIGWLLNGRKKSADVEEEAPLAESVSR